MYEITELSSYLVGFKNLLERLGVDKVWVDGEFTGERDYGLVFFANVPMEIANKITNYVDPEDSWLPEMHSYMLPAYGTETDENIIYEGGKFYANKR